MRFSYWIILRSLNDTLDFLFFSASSSSSSLFDASFSFSNNWTVLLVSWFEISLASSGLYFYSKKKFLINSWLQIKKQKNINNTGYIQVKLPNKRAYNNKEYLFLLDVCCCCLFDLSYWWLFTYRIDLFACWLHLLKHMLLIFCCCFCCLKMLTDDDDKFNLCNRKFINKRLFSFNLVIINLLFILDTRKKKKEWN